MLIKQVAVLGAGVMGAQIAAQLVNAGVPALLFDLPAKLENGKGDKNAIVNKAIANLQKLSPAPLGHESLAQYIIPANYEDDLAKLNTCDLVIEAIAERLDWKHDLYQKIVPHLATHAILASNTSGLPISALASVLPDDVKARFCGVHFFNPPRYMHLVELISISETKPQQLDDLETFLTSSLGKGVVRANDTPNFIANRVGIFSMLATGIEAEKFGLPFDTVDDLTGTKLARAKSATFRTADVVGLDTMAHVIKTMQDTLPNDVFAACYGTPKVLSDLITKGALGQKAKQGFYKKEGKAILVLDPAKGEYVASKGAAEPIIERILKRPASERLKLLRESENPQAQFLWAILRDVFHYSAVHLASIAPSARDVDFAMRWGFGWQQGPFELWQEAGWQTVANWIKEDIAAGKALSTEPLPDWVFTVDGVHTQAGSYSAATNAFIARSNLPVYTRQIFKAPILGSDEPNYLQAGTTVFENAGVRIWLLADGIHDGALIVSFKSKMHTLGPEQLAGLQQAVALGEAQGLPIVIWQGKEPFSAGANLEAMLPVFMQQGAAGIEKAVAGFQQTMMKIKYAQVPVVAAVAGLALGGGCELSLHCSARVAHLESYIGLVEIGVGLVPAGGGLKELALQASQRAAGGNAATAGDIFAVLKDLFMLPAMATVSKSAIEAQKLGFLKPSDTIITHSHELLSVAIHTAKAMHYAGYRAPLPPSIKVAGKLGIANIRGQLINMRDGGFISAYDFELANAIATILCGGEVEPGSLVDENWLLRLEREAFVKFVVNVKTQERMMGMLSTGKPVRN